MWFPNPISGCTNTHTAQSIPIKCFHKGTLCKGKHMTSKRRLALGPEHKPPNKSQLWNNANWSSAFVVTPHDFRKIKTSKLWLVNRRGLPTCNRYVQEMFEQIRIWTQFCILIHFSWPKRLFFQNWQYFSRYCETRQHKANRVKKYHRNSAQRAFEFVQTQSWSLMNKIHYRNDSLFITRVVVPTTTDQWLITYMMVGVLCSMCCT